MYKKHMMHIVIVFYIFSSWLSATHIHHTLDTVSTQYQVCIMVDNFNSADIPISVAVPFVLAVYPSIRNEDTLTIAITIYKGFYAQAPPLFS